MVGHTSSVQLLARPTSHTRKLALLIGAAACTFTTPAQAQDEDIAARLEAMEQRMNALETENRELREALTEQQAEPMPAPAPNQPGYASPPPPSPAPVQAARTQAREKQGVVGTSSDYAYKVLDHAEDVNTKPLIQLQALSDDQIGSRVTLSGQVTGIINQQWSNRADKFGYLMRNPTSANQIGSSVSEAVIHSASIGVTARIADDVTAYAELLYDPQQSFGAGTITALARNQIQLRRGWVMWGNLDKRPVYALLGKMDTPFGLNDTVNPFTNSTNWHAFSGLAYGAQLGYYKDGLHLRAMAIQGGAQFRAANVPVNGTSVPSRLNNFAVDARYALGLGDNPDNQLMVGASYQHGTAYCQGYPIFHFNPCDDNNPGVVAYGKLNYGGLTLIGEYAQTTDKWAGTQVPIPTNPLSVFEAVKPQAFTLGGRYGFGSESEANQGREFALSGEFSKFIAGDDGAPWERQNQIVIGGSWFPIGNLNVFGEYVHVDGFAPLNFLSGGNFPDGSTWSDNGADTNVVMVGAQVAF